MDKTEVTDFVIWVADQQDVKISAANRWILKLIIESMETEPTQMSVGL